MEWGVAMELGHGSTRMMRSGVAACCQGRRTSGGNTSLAARPGEKGAPEKEPKVEAEVEMAGRRREQLWPLPSPPSPCKRIGACLIGWPVGSAALRELSNVFGSILPSLSPAYEGQSRPLSLASLVREKIP